MARRSRSPRPPVEEVHPDPRVWKAALDLAKGDARRLVVRDEETVVVVNQPT